MCFLSLVFRFVFDLSRRGRKGRGAGEGCVVSHRGRGGRRGRPRRAGVQKAQARHFGWPVPPLGRAAAQAHEQAVLPRPILNLSRLDCPNRRWRGSFRQKANAVDAALSASPAVRQSSYSARRCVRTGCAGRVLAVRQHGEALAVASFGQHGPSPRGSSQGIVCGL